MLEPLSWLAFDIEFQPIREAELVDENGQKLWPPQEAQDEAVG